MNEEEAAAFTAGDVVGVEVWYGSGVGGRKRGTVLHLSGPHALRVKSHDTGKPRTVAMVQVSLVDPPRQATPKAYRPPSFEPPKLRSMPKDKPIRSKKYLDWIRAKECSHCAKPGPSWAAHYGGKGASGGMSTKASDLFTVPLCDPCHAHYHQTGKLPGGTFETAARDHIRWERDLLAQWIAGGGVLEGELLIIAGEPIIVDISLAGTIVALAMELGIEVRDRTVYAIKADILEWIDTHAEKL